jgi:DNA polymerase (family 10)
MSTNAALASRFEQMARILELLGEDRFRVNAHARAARTLGSLTIDVGTLAGNRADLLALEGVGPKVADKIIEFVTTGKIKEHQDLLARVPPGLMEVLEVPGVGPKTAKALWDTLNVTSLADLKRVIDDGSILSVPRMGAKAAEKIRGAIGIAEQGAARLPLGRAMPLAERIVARMRGVPGVARAAFAGSLRRGRDTVGDIDILVTTGTPEDAARAFTSLPGVRQVLASGGGRASVRMAVSIVEAAEPPPSPDSSDAATDDSPEPAANPAQTTERTIQVDLKIVPDASWGAALLYFTGSKEHNVRLRERALRRGLTLNEYGLFPNDDNPEPPQKRGVAPVAAANEADIYTALGLAEIPPELREDAGEIDAAELDGQGAKSASSKAPRAPKGPKRDAPKGKAASVPDEGGAAPAGLFGDQGSPATASGPAAATAPPPRRRLPRLIEVADIRAELHAHTTASDGSLSIEELAAMAKGRGFHTIAVTDHSRSSAIAGGLSAERLREHVDAVRRAAAKAAGITILTGSEVDILADGSLDYDEVTLAMLDVVVASPHAALAQDSAAATQRLIRAIEHPRVRILGHPTGRRIGKRKGLEPDMGAVIAAALRHDVALEINAHWMRLDLRDNHVRAAVAAGCLIAIDCDVHRADDFDNLRYGVLTGRRGWLDPERCINCWPADRLHKWLARKG